MCGISTQRSRCMRVEINQQAIDPQRSRPPNALAAVRISGGTIFIPVWQQGNLSKTPHRRTHETYPVCRHSLGSSGDLVQEARRFCALRARTASSIQVELNHDGDPRCRRSCGACAGCGEGYHGRAAQPNRCWGCRRINPCVKWWAQSEATCLPS